MSNFLIPYIVVNKISFMILRNIIFMIELQWETMIPTPLPFSVKVLFEEQHTPAAND